MKTTKKFGFTLAEVLITLGIIGVIAAITIPSLLADVSDKKFRAKFKKSMATLTQVARMGEAQYDMNFATLNQDCGGATDDPNTTASICALFNGTLAGATYYPNLDDARGYNGALARGEWLSSWIAGATWSGYILPDGTIIAFQGNMKECMKYYYNGEVKLNNQGLCHGFIDVNGFAKPNKFVSCQDSSGNRLGSNNLYNGHTRREGEEAECFVKNATDIYGVYFYDNVVEADSDGVYSVLRSHK